MCSLNKIKTWFLRRKPLLAGLAVVLSFGIGGNVYAADSLGFGWWLLSLLPYGILWLEGKVLNLLIWVMLLVINYNGFTSAEAVLKGWSVVRDVSNMGFVVVLLIIAIATIVRYEAYNIKKLLPKLLVMAVLVNFSLTITGLFIDVAQVIMMTFVAGFAGLNQSGFWVSALKVPSLLSGSTETIEQRLAEGTTGTLGAFGSILLAMALGAVLVIVMLVMLAVIMMRIVMLWFLAVLSPLAYILAAFPQGMKYSQRWWSEFGKYLVVGPTLAFFLWLSLTVANTPAGPGQQISQGRENQFRPGEDGENLITDVAQPAGMLNFIISIALLVGALQITAELGVMGGSFAGNMAARIRQAPLGAARQAARPIVGAAKLGWTGAKALGGLGLEALSARTGIELRTSKWKEGWQESRQAHREEREARMFAQASKRGGLVGALATPGHALTTYFRLVGKESVFRRLPKEGLAGGRAEAAASDAERAEKAYQQAQDSAKLGNLVEAGRQDWMGERFSSSESEKRKEYRQKRIGAQQGTPEFDKYARIQVGEEKDDKDKVVPKYQDFNSALKEANAAAQKELVFDPAFSFYKDQDESAYDPNVAGIPNEEKLRRQAYTDFIGNWENTQLAQLYTPAERKANQQKIEQEVAGLSPTELEKRGRQVRLREAGERETEATRLAAGGYTAAQVAGLKGELQNKQSTQAQLARDSAILEARQSAGTATAEEVEKLKVIQKTLKKIDDDIKRLDKEARVGTPSTSEGMERNKTLNAGTIQQLTQEAAMLKGVAEGPYRTEAELEAEVSRAKREATHLSELAREAQPEINYDLLRHQRTGISKEKSDMTSQDWHELLSIFEGAQKRGDLNKMGAAFMRMTEDANENELFNSFGYESGAKGLRDFTYGQLVGKKGMSRQRARELGYSDSDYDDFADGGLSEFQAGALASDAGYIGESKNHWQVARSVSLKNGRYEFQAPANQQMEIHAEMRKRDFEGLLRQANRLAFGIEVPEGANRQERADNFRATGKRSFHDAPSGLAFYTENAEKFSDKLRQGRFNISWAVNLVSPTGKAELLQALDLLSDKERAVGKEVLKKIETFAGERQKEDPFGLVRKFTAAVESGKVGGAPKGR